MQKEDNQQEEPTMRVQCREGEKGDYSFRQRLLPASWHTAVKRLDACWVTVSMEDN